MKKTLLFAALLLAAGISLKAQLTGTLNVPGAYPTLAAAITDLNTQGVGAGGVTINVVAGNPQSAPAGGYAITATGTATNTIVITGTGNIITAGAQAAGNLNDAIFKIIGGDFITISQFVMQENPANTNMTPGTNTMTEWGVALLYASATNGAQFNNIIGNTISLNRAYPNTWGVYSNVRHNSTSISTTNDITAPSGSNSNNKVWGNGITNVNMGIAFIGSNNVNNADAGNDIGGSMSLTGNTITDWGGAAAASSYISNSGTSYGIFMNHQTGMNVSFNTVTSATVTPTVTFRGIVQDFTAGTWAAPISNTISSNTVTMTSGQTSGTFRAIDVTNAGSTGTTNITTNTIRNCAITGVGSSSTLVAIASSGVVATLNISFNHIHSNTSSATSGGFTGITSSSAVTAATSINSNQVGSVFGNAITFSAAQTGTVSGIINSGGAAGSTVNITNNNIQGMVHSVTGSATHTYISNTSGNPNTNINSNTFTDLTVNSTGSLNFITNNVTHVPNTVHNVNNNSVVTQFTKSGAGGTVFFYNSFSTSLTQVVEINNGNDFSNMTFTGATTISGWRCGDGSTTAPFGPEKTVTNNTFSNITGGTNAMVILEVDYSNANAATNNVSGNVISNITGGGAVTGILSAQGRQNFFLNTITGLTGGGLVMGISITGGATQNIFRNKIGNLENTVASQTIGMRVSAGTTVTMTNNLIGDLRAPVSSGPNQLMGISITGGTTMEVWHNTIYLNGTSTGTDFGSSGIQASTSPNLDLRNNLIINTSTPNGTGLTVGLRRNNTTLTSYSVASGNNSFYVGTPSASRLIFYDGTNADQTINAFRARVTPADANSITANPPFASTTASNANFLHIAAATATGVESGGMTIPGFSTDYDNDMRPGPIPSVNGGGTAPDIGADEFDGVPGCLGAPPTVIPGISPASVCGSGTFILSAGSPPTTEGITYQWQEATVSGGPYTDIVGATAATYTTSAISSTMYYVFVITCANSGLTSVSSELTATVYPAAVVSASVTQSTVCFGESVTFNGSGADTYLWTGGVTDNTPFTPTVTDSYTVTGTDINGCTDTAVVSVTVNNNPTVGASSTASAICLGDFVTLNGSGAVSYTWTGGVTDNVPFAPTVTDSYTVTGTDANGCTNTMAISVTVNFLPMVGASVTQSAICSGDSVTFNGSGAVSYTWTGGVTDNVPFTPASTDTYTVTGTDANGCTNTMTIGVTVNALPAVTLSLPLDTLCQTVGTITLSGESPAGGTWAGPGVSGNTFDPMASGLGTFGVNYMYTDTNGCSAMSTDSLFVGLCLDIAGSAASNEATIYPNPNYGVFTIELSGSPSSPVQVEIMNELGQVVNAFTMNGTRADVNISDLEGGVYFVRVINGNEVSVHRVVKQ